jgi:hypothetical protein
MHFRNELDAKASGGADQGHSGQRGKKEPR